MASTYFVLVERRGAGRYVASVPSFRGCVGEGGTPEEAVSRVRRACQSTVRRLRVDGRPLPPSRTFLVSTLDLDARSRQG